METWIYIFLVLLYTSHFLPSYSDLGYDHYLHGACFHLGVQISMLLRKYERVGLKTESSESSLLCLHTYEKLLFSRSHLWFSVYLVSYWLINSSDDSLILQELIGNYIYMEEYFMRETVMKVSLVLLLKLKI